MDANWYVLVAMVKRSQRDDTRVSTPLDARNLFHRVCATGVHINKRAVLDKQDASDVTSGCDWPEETPCVAGDERLHRVADHARNEGPRGVPFCAPAKHRESQRLDSLVTAPITRSDFECEHRDGVRNRLRMDFSNAVGETLERTWGYSGDGATDWSKERVWCDLELFRELRDGPQREVLPRFNTLEILGPGAHLRRQFFLRQPARTPDLGNAAPYGASKFEGRGHGRTVARCHQAQHPPA